jgi:hypothetical protein
MSAGCAAMGDVQPSDAARASGVVNTSFMMGGALGLAALTGGYHAAFLIGALFAAGAAFIGGVFLRPKDMPAHQHEEAVGVPAVAEADCGARPR